MNHRTDMVRCSVVALVLIIICITPLGVRAETSPTVPTDEVAVPTTPRSLLSLTDIQAAQLSPLTQEIRTVLLKERADVSELTARLAGTTDDLEAISLQRRIATIKEQAEIDIMEVQAKHAEAGGDTQKAAEIRKLLEGMQQRVNEKRNLDGGQP